MRGLAPLDQLRGDLEAAIGATAAVDVTRGFVASKGRERQERQVKCDGIGKPHLGNRRMIRETGAAARTSDPRRRNERVEPNEPFEQRERDDRIALRDRAVRRAHAAERHPAHEGAENDADGGRGRPEGQQQQPGPCGLEKESGETADEECQQQEDALRRHVES